MIDLNKGTGWTLKYGIAVGIATLIVGLIAGMVSDEIGESLLLIGIGIMVFIPFASIIVSALALYIEKDVRWFRCVLVLIAVSVVGMYVAMVF